MLTGRQTLHLRIVRRPVCRRQRTEAGTEDNDSVDAGLDLDDLLDSDLDTLRNTRVATPDLNTEVTSVARTEVAIGKTPAAIFVITEEMIRRSAAATLPDVLRMVPGLNVAKSSNGRWSIGARGTGAIFADSLQVQIDGRSIYTPVFGGVVWRPWRYQSRRLSHAHPMKA